MSFTATHRFARISPRKARLVMNLIKGRNVDDAITVLRFNKQRSAVLVAQVVKSAIANAAEQEASTNTLYVMRAVANPGPIIKRFQPKDRGKAYEIKKRTSHLVVELGERDKLGE